MTGRTLLMFVGFAFAAVYSSWAAPYTWNGNGNSNNSGSWSDTTMWNTGLGSTYPVGSGNASSDDVILPDVSSGTRTVTFTGTNAGFHFLTINQTTAGAASTLTLNASINSGNTQWNYNSFGLSFNPPGTFTLNKGSYDFRPYWGDHTNPPETVWGANTIINSTGGTIADKWDTPRMRLDFQGQLNLSGGTTGIAAGTGVTIDTGGVLNLTSGGGLDNGITSQAGQPSVYGFTLKGTLNGNNTGLIKSVKVTIDTGATITAGPATIITQALDIKSSTPANINLAGTSVYRGTSNAPFTIEVASTGSGSNFKIGTLKLVNAGGGTQGANRTRLVNNYDNSGAQASEYLLVGSLDYSGSYQEELDLNDHRLVIDGGVANFISGGAGTYLGNRSSGTGSIEFRTPGGTLNMSSMYVGVSGGGMFQIVGPASISNFSLYDPGTGLGSAGGTIAFNGNISTVNGMTVTFNSANASTTLDLSGNTFTLNTTTNCPSISVTNGATLTIKGNTTGYAADAGKGLRAVGTTKTGAGTPVVTPAGNIEVTGNMTYASMGFSTYIGRDATLKVGGNFDIGYWWGGFSGAASRSFFADTSTHAGSLIFNGGGAVQTMEILSKGYSTVTGLSYFQASGAAPAAGQTVTGASSGASGTISFINGDILQLTGVSSAFQANETLNFSGGGTARAYDTQFAGLDGQTSGSIVHLPIGTLSIGDPSGNTASVKLVNAYNPWGPTEDMQVARNLTVTSSSTLDLNGYQMTVALGSATVKGSVTDTFGVGRTSTLLLANNASLTVDGGTVSVDQLTLNAGSNLSLLGGATLSNTAFTLAGTNTVTNTSGANTIANSMTLNGPVTLATPAGTLNISAAIGGASGSVVKSGAGTAVYGSTATYGGTTAINGGVLRVNGAYSGGAITVNSGGTLGGTGPISSPITMAGGTINPGASPGTLTVSNAAVNFGSGGTLAIEIAGLGGGQYDLLNITGTGSLNLSGANDVLDLYILNPYYSQIGDTLTVVTSPSIIGNFDTLRLFGGAWPGAYTVSYPGGNSAQIQFLISIPEPTTLVLGGFGALLLLRRRHRVPATA